MPTTNFDISVLTPSGLHEDFIGAPYRRMTGLGTRWDGVATGTDCNIQVIANDSACVEAQVDGGSWTDVTPGTTGSQQPMTVFTGLSDTAHTFAFRAKATGVLYAIKVASVAVTGASPALTGDPNAAGKTVYIFNPTGFGGDSIYGATGIASNIQLESGSTAAANGHADYTVIVSAVQGAPLVRYLATCTPASSATVEVWSLADGQIWSLIVDGVLQASVTDSGSGAWEWTTIATGLPTGVEVIHQLTNVIFNSVDASLGAGTVFALRITGAVNTSTLPSVRTSMANYGDSITANQTADGDATKGWIFQLSYDVNFSYFNVGISSSTVKYFGSNASAGEHRTADVTGISPEPNKCTVIYGVNDLGQIAGAETVEEFQAAYTNMMGLLLAGTTTCKFYCVGLFVNVNYDPSTITLWSAAIAAAVAAQADPRCVYVDPTPWGLDETTDFLAGGIHPNAAGAAKIAAGLNSVMFLTVVARRGRSFRVGSRGVA